LTSYTTILDYLASKLQIRVLFVTDPPVWSEIEKPNFETAFAPGSTVACGVEETRMLGAGTCRARLLVK